MKTILVTGANGFVGKNLCAVLRQKAGVLYEYDLNNTPKYLETALSKAELIFHLAGVNRPQKMEEYQSGNVGFTEEICSRLLKIGRTPKIVFASSVQAERDNLYGVSKRSAEESLQRFCEQSGSDGVVYRLKNLFGKWCRPNYNSVVATFCHNIARDLPIEISDPATEIELTYIDDVVNTFASELERDSVPGFGYADPLVSYRITLGNLAEKIKYFHNHRQSLYLADFSTRFTKALYATYLSFLETGQLDYRLDVKSDDRGSLAEFIKSPSFGQIFLSRTRPGIIRGNHYHQTKCEKFMIVQGEGIICLRHILSDKIVEYHISGQEYRVVDIPPGYTHSIENVGAEELVTLFWSDEIFDSGQPDTTYEPVKKMPCRLNDMLGR